MAFNKVFTFLSAIWLPAMIGCNGPMFGGSDTRKVEDDQAPKTAVAALLALHTDAHIDWIDRVSSNGPTFYRLHYHQPVGDSQAPPPPGVFLYSDCRLGPDLLLYPDRVRDAFKSSHPDATIDKVEEFEDLGRQPAYYRLQYRVGTIAVQKAYFNPDGDVIATDPGRT